MQINEVTRLDVENGVALLAINSPPVNTLSAPVRKGVAAGLEYALANEDVRGIVLLCEGRTFFAGADIKEFDRPPEQPDLRALCALLEQSSKPVVAALHGTALGGGLEIALACNYRVCVPSARMGLPEVALGILPGAGGTQRLPRIIGVEAALDMMISGKPIKASDALNLGLVDAVAPEDGLSAAAIALLEEAIAHKAPLPRVRDREEHLAQVRSDTQFFARYRTKNARALRGFKAPEQIVRAVEAAVALPFDEGLAREYEIFLELVDSVESAAQRYLFFAERLASKIPDIASDTPKLPIGSVGVIGAGTMGAGIAMCFLNAGIPVTVMEQQQAALDRGVNTIRSTYEAAVRKGRLSEAGLEERMARLSPTLSIEALAGVDLAVEAVFENLAVKQDVFRQLDAVLGPNAILASNTSVLDLDAIADVTSRPESVVGLHFFSPAHIMRLLEVVRGAKTSKTVVATAMQIGAKLGKVAVLSRVCHGFIANRMMRPRQIVADAVILRGPTPSDIDRVMSDFGFPMGPFAMLDLVGLDVIGRADDGQGPPTVVKALCDAGRWGQKRSAGYYDYDEQRVATHSVAVAAIIREFSQKAGSSQQSFTNQDLVEQLLAPVVNEGVKILQEGIASRASDIDLALVQGYAWPAWTGGPLFWADNFGLDRLVAVLETLAEQHGEQFLPADLLRSCALQGTKLHQIGA